MTGAVSQAYRKRLLSTANSIPNMPSSWKKEEPRDLSESNASTYRRYAAPKVINTEVSPERLTPITPSPKNDDCFWPIPAEPFQHQRGNKRLNLSYPTSKDFEAANQWRSCHQTSLSSMTWNQVPLDFFVDECVDDDVPATFITGNARLAGPHKVVQSEVSEEEQETSCFELGQALWSFFW
jgi:hypothetical protein